MGHFPIHYVQKKGGFLHFSPFRRLDLAVGLGFAAFLASSQDGIQALAKDHEECGEEWLKMVEKISIIHWLSNIYIYDWFDRL